MIKLPAVRFNTESGNRYIYDAYSNNVYPISKLDEWIIDRYCDQTEKEITDCLEEKYDVEEIKKSYQKIQRWHIFEGSFFADRLISMKKDLSLSELDKALANCSEICFIMTENCNLRCRYCIYSGQYEYERTHNNIHMNFQTARKALDYFSKFICSHNRTTTQDFFYIGFYGGETFLNFKLMEKIVAYAKNLDVAGHKIKFTATTNGTLLTERKIDFCIENELYLNISLDGPKEYHDQARVFKNHSGTFDTIIANLKKIKQRSNDYFTTNVNFLVTLAPYYEIPQKIIDFFLNNDIFKTYDYTKIPRIASFDRSNLRNDSELYKSARDSKLPQNLDTLYNEYREMLIENNTQGASYEILSALLGDSFSRFFKRPVGNCKDIPFYTATCIPGARKLVIMPNGDIAFCEKLNPYMTIGNIQQGIDYKKVRDIFNKYISSFNNRCLKCPSIRLCNICFAGADCGKNFNPDKVCKQNMPQTPKVLSEIFTLLEKNPNAFNNISKYEKAWKL